MRLGKIAKKPLPFEELLKAAGAEFECIISEFGQGYSSTPEYRFRYNYDEVQIAVNAKFDRWANSINFLCRPLPSTQEDFDALMVALDKVIKEKRADEDDGVFDIWPFVRKIRRESRNEIPCEVSGIAP